MHIFYEIVMWKPKQKKKISRICNFKLILSAGLIHDLTINLRFPRKSSFNIKIWWVESGDIRSTLVNYLFSTLFSYFLQKNLHFCENIFKKFGYSQFLSADPEIYLQFKIPRFLHLWGGFYIYAYLRFYIYAYLR